jgi:hypothetical protein
MDVDEILPISALTIYEMLFGNKSSTFWEEWDKESKATGRKAGEWINGTRELVYVVPMNNPMVKLKELEVISKQAEIKKVEQECYVVHIINNTPAAPYGDSFSTETRFCITKINNNQCRLKISNGVTFSKSPMVKGIIKSNGLKGLGETARSILNVIYNSSEYKEANQLRPIKQKFPSGETKNHTNNSIGPWWNNYLVIMALFLCVISIGFNFFSYDTMGHFNAEPVDAPLEKVVPKVRYG